MRRFLAFCMALLVVACGSALDVMTTQAEWQLTQLEACYDSELAAIDAYPYPQYDIARLAIKTKYDMAFGLYRDYRAAVLAGDEEDAKEMFAVFTAVAAGASARCIAAIPQPEASSP